MDDIKIRLKEFLLATGMTREDLAAKLGVRKSQIDKWFSKTPVPPARVKLIEFIMKDCGYTTPDTPAEIRIKIPQDQLRKFQTEADLRGLNITEWTVSVLDAHASVPCKRR